MLKTVSSLWGHASMSVHWHWWHPYFELFRHILLLKYLKYVLHEILLQKVINVSIINIKNIKNFLPLVHVLTQLKDERMAAKKDTKQRCQNELRCDSMNRVIQIRNSNLDLPNSEPCMNIALVTIFVFLLINNCV